MAARDMAAARRTPLIELFQDVLFHFW